MAKLCKTHTNGRIGNERLNYSVDCVRAHTFFLSLTCSPVRSLTKLKFLFQLNLHRSVILYKMWFRFAIGVLTLFLSINLQHCNQRMEWSKKRMFIYFEHFVLWDLIVYVVAVVYDRFSKWETELLFMVE